MTEVDEGFRAWQRRVEGTNISSTTLLATDYLNHFNEIIMLLDMVPAMPEMVEECRAWEPLDYQDHFRQSGFRDKDLAIAAYDHVPARYREPFEETIGQINDVVEASLAQMQAAQDAGDEETLVFKAQAASRVLQRLLEVASAIIHGSEVTMNQGEIDRLLG